MEFRRFGLGMVLEWRYQAAACALIPVAFHVVMYFVPESPRYLIEIDKHEKAVKAVTWLKRAKKSPHVVSMEISQVNNSKRDFGIFLWEITWGKFRILWSPLTFFHDL